MDINCIIRAVRMELIAGHALLLLLLYLLTQPSAVKCGSNSGVFLNREAFLPKNLDDTRQQLASHVIVSCNKDGIDVEFNRTSVFGLGVVHPSQLALLDPNCKSSVNTTHFHLHFEFMDCGTKISISDDKRNAIIKNTVMISPPTMLFTNEELQDPSSEEVVEIEFTCTYKNSDGHTTVDNQATDVQKAITKPMTEAPLPIPTQELLSAPTLSKASIHLYNTDSYVQEIDVNNEKIVRGTSLYVKINAFDDTNKERGVFIDSCYLSGVPQPEVKSNINYLINNSCVIHHDVQFKQSEPNTPQKFLFRARRYYGNKPTYLHCTLIPCYGSGAEKCTIQQQYCDRHVKSSLPQFVVTLQGGLKVIRRSPNKPPPVISEPQRKPTVMADAPASCPPSIKTTCKCPKPSPQSPQSTASSQVQGDDDSDNGNTVSLTLTIVTAVASFFIGAVLMLLIWFIYNKTDPRLKMHHSVPSSDDSTSSQESTIPTTKLMSQSTDPPTSYES